MYLPLFAPREAAFYSPVSSLAESVYSRSILFATICIVFFVYCVFNSIAIRWNESRDEVAVRGRGLWILNYQQFPYIPYFHKIFAEGRNKYFRFLYMYSCSIPNKTNLEFFLNVSSCEFFIRSMLGKWSSNRISQNLNCCSVGVSLCHYNL